MTVTDYCLMVQDRVLKSKPESTGTAFDDWFADTGRASNAVTCAIECRNSDALRIAEKLARQYGLPNRS